MLKSIIRKELQNHLYSLRFQISFFLIISIYLTGTIAHLKNHQAKSREYTKYQSEFRERLRGKAEENATLLAIHEANYLLHPRENGFISDCKEKYFPSKFIYTAYHVREFAQHEGSINPYLNNFRELNWSFIAAFITSFLVLLLTFDSISGEKERHTLAIMCSNSVSRSILLFGKYLSAVIITMVVTLIGMLVSLLILLFSHQLALTSMTALEILGFLVLVLFFVSCLAAFGILSSVTARIPNVSLLIALTFWLLFVVVIPNTAIFWANKLFPIEHLDIFEVRLERTWRDIAENAPQGTWSWMQNPFYPHHESRASTQTKMWDAIMELANEYYQDMFNQLERTRKLTQVSPVALFEYMNEGIVGGGYLRFQKIWEDLHGYQTQFLAFFKELDAKDPDSPHWFNPRENISTTRKPVSFDQVPLFEEKPIPIADRFLYLKNYLMVMILYSGVIFFLTFVLFVRYDVR